MLPYALGLGAASPRSKPGQQYRLALKYNFAIMAIPIEGKPIYSNCSPVMDYTHSNHSISVISRCKTGNIHHIR